MAENNKPYKTKSMTAFARVQHESALADFVWEIKSVNHRYLDTHFKLPEKLRAIEMTLRETLRKRLARGKLDVHLHFKANNQDAAYSVDQGRLASLMVAVKEVSQLASLESQPSVVELLQWPGILEQSELNIDLLHDLLLSTFNQAIDELIKSREAEGDKLAALIAERLDQIDQLVEKVEQRMPEILSEHKVKLLARLDELTLEIDDDRIAQEVVMLAQKTDIAEELDRLRAHVSEVRETLRADGPSGRRMDFLMQELNREANTLGSKSIQFDTSRGAVDLKVLIEQMREQVQNIE